MPKLARWENLLESKGKGTSEAYRRHIKQFIHKMGPVPNYTQDCIDAYYAGLRREDKERPPGKRESKATHKQRVAALKFYIMDCLGLKLNFKDFKNKNAR